VKSLGEPRPGDIVNADSLQLALRTMFQPEEARELKASFEVRVGETVVHALVDHGALEVAEGPLDGADLVLESELPLNPLLSGELDPAEAIESGRVRVKGQRRLLDRFIEIFRIPPLPVMVPA
jgi:putative sterol carrier protein